MEGDQTKNPNNAAMPNSAPVQAANPPVQPTASGAQAAQQPAMQPAPQASMVQSPQASQAPHPVQDTSAQPTSAPAQVVNPANTNPSSQVAFKSSDIGVKTTVKEDPFAPQNQRTAAKKQHAKKERKKFYLIGGVIVAVVVIALIIWGLIVILNSGSEGDGGIEKPVMPTDASAYEPESDRIVSSTVENVGDLAQEAFQADGNNPEAAQEIFDAAIQDITNNNQQNNGQTQAYINQVQISELLFYLNNGYNDKIIEMEKEIKPETMTDEQVAAYYNIIYNAYANEGTNQEKINEYANLMFESAQKAGGFGDGE